MLKKKLAHIYARTRITVKEEGGKGRKIPSKTFAQTTWEKNFAKYGRSFLGKITDERRQLIAKHTDNTVARERAALQLANERLARGHKDSIYFAHQPWYAPSINEMVEYNLRIGVLWPMVKGSSKMSWCQGKVIRRSQNEGPRSVEVEWDAVEDMPSSEVLTISSIELLESDWRSTRKWGWRLDMELELLENFYDKDDKEIMMQDNDCDGDEAALDSDISDSEGEDDGNYDASDSEREYLMGLDSDEEEDWSQ